ncbi:MAG: hypothetical protein JO345_10230 [Streptosporangiaceae bacterium]|nr:hypothetical protein [Streptosporangiaceae bacterium]
MEREPVGPDQIAEELQVTPVERLRRIGEVPPPRLAEGYRLAREPRAALAGSGDVKSAQSATTM